MSNPAKESIIDAGIEWYAYRDADGDLTREGCQCARCGSSAELRTCWSCGGDGVMDDDVAEYDYEFDDWEMVPCSSCGGTGGSYHCVSDPEWCEANPITGREHIASTAIRPEEWE